MTYKTTYLSPIGMLTIVSDGENIIALLMEKERYGIENADNAIIDENIDVLNRAKAWLDRYFAGEKPDISELPLKPEGSDFRHAVWNILIKIPYGQVTTYGEIAKMIASMRGKEKMSAQAVGGAVGHNPISIIIPCHRVIGTNGSLTGFGGGIPAKVKLLQHEGVDMSKMFIPAHLEEF